MKNRFFKLLALFLVFVSFSCASTKKEDKNMLGEFNSVNMGKIMVAVVPRIKTELSPRDVTFVFSPKTNLVSFHHRFMGDNIWVTLNYEERQVMIEAIKKYMQAYKNGELTEKNNKKKAYFGKTSSYMAWGLLGITHKAKPILRFEYQQFGAKKLPYFIVATATHTSIDDDMEANSPAIRLALSPAKCQEFLLRLYQDNLQKIVDELQADFEKFAPDPEFDINEGAEKNEDEKTMAPDEAEFEF
ncbi:MAG: hypothetical protein P1P64_00805 [Treponemataceae bacterium]